MSIVFKDTDKNVCSTLWNLKTQKKEKGKMRNLTGNCVVVIGLAFSCSLMISCIDSRHPAFVFPEPVVIAQEPAVVPPRTIESAQKQYNDQSFVPGKTTVTEMQTALGSPAEIKKEANGDKTYIYIKNVYSTGVTVDVGTTYVGEYTFDSKGLYKEKNLLARPMSNPLIH